MNLQALIVLYAYVCVCVVLFDLLFWAHTAHNQRAMPKRVRLLRGEIARQAEQGCIGGKRLLRRLSDIRYLTAFSQLLQSDFPPMGRWVGGSLPFLLALGRLYSKKPRVSKAFYTHVLARLSLGRVKIKKPEDRAALKQLERLLVDMMGDRSVYVRENAFKALLSFGSAAHVLDALLCVNETPAHQSEKLLTDDLLLFQGGHKLLAALIWQSFGRLTVTLRVAFVNYLRLLPQGAAEQAEYYAPLCQMLCGEKTHKELRLAILRYFKKYSYPAACDEMLRLVKNPGSPDWEYAAVAAGCLTVCPRARAVPVLLQAAKSPNWHLRLNAVESLLALGVRPDPEALKKTDAYAGDMLGYRMQINDIN